MERNLTDTIREYLRQQLPAEEKAAFERRLAEDTSFAAAVADEAALYAAIEEEGDRRLALELERYSRELLQRQAPVVRKFAPYRGWLLAAAVLAGILVVILPLWFTQRQGNQPASPEAIFAAHFSVPPVSGVRDSAREPWRVAFAGKEYSTAIDLLNNRLADTAFTGRSEALLYQGIALLALNQPDSALQSLEQVSPDSYDWELAQWYQALALIRLKRVGAAQKILQTIEQQPAHSRRKAAESLLEAIEKIEH